MDPYILLLVGAGGLILLVAWLPMALRELPLSLPIFCVAFGFAAFGLSSLSGGETPDPLRFPEIAERLTELVVIIALTGAALKLDRPFGWRTWSMTWRLLTSPCLFRFLASRSLGTGCLGWARRPRCYLAPPSRLLTRCSQPTFRSGHRNRERKTRCASL